MGDWLGRNGRIQYILSPLFNNRRIRSFKTFWDLSFDLHPLLKEISSVVKRSLYESASWCHSRFTNRRKRTNTSLPFSQSPFLPSSLSYRYTHTRMKTPQRNCFPICQKAEHEQLKIAEDDRYRQTDRRVQEALQSFNLCGKYIFFFFVDENIACNSFSF